MHQILKIKSMKRNRLRLSSLTKQSWQCRLRCLVFLWAYSMWFRSQRFGCHVLCCRGFPSVSVSFVRLRHSWLRSKLYDIIETLKADVLRTEIDVFNLVDGMTGIRTRPDSKHPKNDILARLEWSTNESVWRLAVWAAKANKLRWSIPKKRVATSKSSI